MENDDIDKERMDAFLRDLLLISKKHGIAIGSVPFGEPAEYGKMREGDEWFYVRKKYGITLSCSAWEGKGKRDG